MGTLAEQLMKANLVSKDQYQSQQAIQEFEDSEKANQVAKGTALIEELRNADSMKKFRGLAKKVLARDPGQINEVIRLAHKFKDATDPVAKKFIWVMYQLRDGLKSLPEAEQEKYIKRALRQHSADLGVD